MKKVNCSKCNLEMDCPESMLKAEHHICADCADKMAPEDDLFAEEDEKESIETMKYADEVVNELVDLKFEALWKNNKDDFKELSKKDLAREMLYEGIGELLLLLSATGFTKDELVRLRELAVTAHSEDEQQIEVLFEKWKKEDEEKGKRFGNE